MKITAIKTKGKQKTTLRVCLTVSCYIINNVLVVKESYWSSLTNGAHIVSSYKSNFPFHPIRAFLLYRTWPFEQESAAAQGEKEYWEDWTICSDHPDICAIIWCVRIQVRAVSPGCDVWHSVTSTRDTWHWCKYKEIELQIKISNIFNHIRNKEMAYV